MLSKRRRDSAAKVRYTLGLRLRMLRDAAGLTQQELADKIGISRCAVANIETRGDMFDSTLSFWFLAAKALRVKLAFLLKVNDA